MSRPSEVTGGPREHRLLAFAWGETPIGPSDRWPGSLWAAVDLMLGIDAPSALFVGPQLIQMHNPAFGALYRDDAAATHGLGRSLKQDHPGGRLDAAAATVFAGGCVVLRDQDAMGGPPGGATYDLSCVPLRDESGQVSAMLVLACPVASAVAEARDQAPLISELQHRVRNILAVVRSLVARSAETSDTVEDFAAHLDGRIGAVTRVQSVLVRNPRAGVDLESLVRDELLAQHADEDRLRVDGPEIVLPAKAAEVLTLAVHELATNALKYGALSQPSGKLEITWRLEADGTPARRLELVWLETGVRIAGQAPRREGFGTNLLKRRLPYELEGEADIEFRPGGLICRIAFPLAARQSPPAGGTKEAKTSEDFA